MRKGFNKRIAGVSINVWMLLFIPVSIAFLVGGYGPTIIEEDFNIYSAIGWAIFIFIVDLTILRTESVGVIKTFRLILLLLSMTITATVGDLIFFDADIKEYKAEAAKTGLNDRIIVWKVDKQEAYEEMREQQKTGEGPLFKIKQAEYQTLLNNPPTSANALPPGPLTNINHLHMLLVNKPAALLIFIMQMIMFGLFEAMPFMLKNAKLKRQYQ